MSDKRKRGTKAVHAGIMKNDSEKALSPPIYFGSSYAQKAPGEAYGNHEYSRISNPTRSAVEDALAELENGAHGFCFSSGVAAIDAVLRLLKHGDEIVCSNDVYGGTYRIMSDIYVNHGIRCKFVSIYDHERLKVHLDKHAKLLWIETPSNPLLNIVDIQAAVKLAKESGVLVCVDNTFATPYLQRPLELGADIVCHSATKYIGGHSDLLMGAVVVNDDALAEKFRFIQKACGAVASPMDAFLALRGLKTLHVRMDRHCKNAETVAKFLHHHEAVEEVYWPGFFESPYHDLACRQMDGFGGVVSFRVKDALVPRLNEFFEKLELFTLAESLGGVESIVGYPVKMSHAGMNEEDRRNTGITENLVRLSIGIEYNQDLVDDLAQALAYIMG